jgi:hypothetical protein
VVDLAIPCALFLDVDERVDKPLRFVKVGTDDGDVEMIVGR